MLILEFTNETKQKIEKDLFEKLIQDSFKVLEKHIKGLIGKRNGGIDLVLVNDSAIQQLNKDYRKKNKPTDVISFAYLEVTEYKKEKGDIIVGDIFISLDTAKKQAKEKGHSLKEELEFLFVHGLLHLFGFDHNTDEEEAEMEGWAKKILEYKR